MTLDELLAQPGPLLPAWELNDLVVHTLRVHRIGEGGAPLVGRVDVDPEELEATNNALLDRGLRVGFAYYAFVWVLDDAGLGVWSKTQQLAFGTRDELHVGGHDLRARDLDRVSTFVDPDNDGHRGVKAHIASYGMVVAEENFSVDEEMYSASDLDWEIMWAEFLGRDLALWLGVRYSDRHGKVTNQAQLDLHTACRALAERVETHPGRGVFEHVFQALDTTGTAELRFAPDPDGGDQRFVELRVLTPGRKSWYGRWLKLGTNAHVAAFLRGVRTPALIMTLLPELRRNLVADGYG